MVGRFGLNATSRHVEIASNDGYLLQYSINNGIKCLGVEPCESVALAALAKGIDTRIEFFGRRALSPTPAQPAGCRIAWIGRDRQKSE
jgi:hypothetical protein